MTDVSLDNARKKFLIAGVSSRVTGGLADGDGFIMTPQGDRRIGVRGLYGDGVWVKQENEGHWKIDVNCMEVSELNTILHAARRSDLILPILYEDGSKTLLAGTAMVMTDPVLKGSASLVVHTFMLETFNFIGVIAGRRK